MNLATLANILAQMPELNAEEVTIVVKTTDPQVVQQILYKVQEMQSVDWLSSLDLRFSMEGCSLSFKPNPNPPQPEEGQGVEEAPVQLE